MYTFVMDTLLAGFGDELTKLATPKLSEFEKKRRKSERDLRSVTEKAQARPDLFERLRGKGAPRKRDYLASAALGALTYPLIGILRGKVGRGLRNRTTLKAMASASRRERRGLRRKLESGNLVARSHLTKKKGQLSREDMLARTAHGAVAGSLITALRDRFAGSTPAN